MQLRPQLSPRRRGLPGTSLTAVFLSQSAHDGAITVIPSSATAAARATSILRPRSRTFPQIGQGRNEPPPRRRELEVWQHCSRSVGVMVVRVKTMLPRVHAAEVLHCAVEVILAHSRKQHVHYPHAAEVICSQST